MTAAPARTVLPALMYHSVSAIGGPLRDLAVPPARLAEQLAALTAAGYRLTGLSAALDRIDAGRPERLVAVTFDDGYADFLRAGVPALVAAGAGATLYASTGHLGGHAGWLGRASADFGRMLTWDELGEVAAAGIEIGDHSLIHHPLDVLPPRTLDDEIRRSHTELEQRLGRRVRSFAYPHGYHNRRVRRVVAGLGYDNATEVGRRLYVAGDDRLAIPRFQPTPDMSGADLVALVGGGGPWLGPRLKQLAQPAWRLVRRISRAAGRELT